MEKLYGEVETYSLKQAKQTEGEKRKERSDKNTARVKVTQTDSETDYGQNKSAALELTQEGKEQGRTWQNMKNKVT